MHAGLNLPARTNFLAAAVRRRRRPPTLRGSAICPRARLPTWRSSSTTRRTGSSQIQPQGADFRYSSWSSAGTRRSAASVSTLISWRRARASITTVSSWRPPCRSSRTPPSGLSPRRAESSPSARAPGRKRGTFQFPRNCRRARCSAFWTRASPKSLRCGPECRVGVSGAICGHAERWREAVETRAEIARGLRRRRARPHRQRQLLLSRLAGPTPKRSAC